MIVLIWKNLQQIQFNFKCFAAKLLQIDIKLQQYVQQGRLAQLVRASC